MFVELNGDFYTGFRIYYKLDMASGILENQVEDKYKWLISAPS